MNTAALFVDLAAKSVVVLFAAWVLYRVFGKSSAAVKHLIWLSAFCVILAAPVLTAFLPARAIVIRPPAGDAIATSGPAEVAGGGLARRSFSEGGFVPTLPVAEGRQSVRWDDPSTVKPLRLPEDGIGLHTDLQPMTARNVGTSPPTATPAGPDWGPIGSAVLTLWLLGSAIVALQSLYALAAVGRLRRRSQPLEGKEIDRGRLSRQLGVIRPWELRVCAGPKAPAAMTWGVMNPVVMIPQESASWTRERLEAVVLHELAHVRRFDSVSQLIAVLACIVYWFNPAVWLCARAMRAEAEIAADDTVLGLGVRPSDYARELVRIAAELGTRRQPYSTIGVPVMKKSKIESRVQAILDPSNRRRRGISTAQILTTAAVAAAIVIPVSMLRATLVPIEPHGILTVHQNDDKAKQEQERATLEAVKAKMQADEAARKGEIDKKAAELAVAHGMKEKKFAEAQKAQAEALKRAAENAGRADGKAREAAMKEYRAALQAQEQAAKGQKMERLQQMEALYAQSQAQNAASKAEKLFRLKQMKSLYDPNKREAITTAQLKAVMAELSAQRAQLKETQARLQEVLRALKQAKESQADRASYKERLEALYKQRAINKDALNAAKAEAVRKTIEDLDRKGYKMDLAHSPAYAEERLRQAQEALKAAKSLAEDTKARYTAGVISKEEYDKAVFAVVAAEGRVRLSEIALGELKKKK